MIAPSGAGVGLACDASEYGREGVDQLALVPQTIGVDQPLEHQPIEDRDD